MEVIDLGGRRSFLTDYEDIRRRIVGGAASGAAVVLLGSNGHPEVVLCGDFKGDPTSALQAIMQASIALSRTRGGDDDESTVPPRRTRR